MRRNTEFHEGDFVVIREWEDMEEEYGLNRYGSIHCYHSFVDEMKEFCGTEVVIESINQHTVRFAYPLPDGMERYSWSTDMICHAEESYTPEEVPEDDFMALINSWV